MKVEIIKRLFWHYGYNIRATAILAECTEDYVRKIIKGRRGTNVPESDFEWTEGMLRRKKVIDRIYSLKGSGLVSNEQKFQYISLLSYLGFELPELSILFKYNVSTFISVAALRSAQAWRYFKPQVLGITEEDYRYTFIEKEQTIQKAELEKPTPEAEQKALDARDARREAKLVKMREHKRG